MSARDDIAETLLQAAAKAGADQADVIVSTSAALDIGVADGALEQAERAESREAGLRVIVGQRQACVSSSDCTPAMLALMAERAVALAREAPDDPTCGLAPSDLVGGHAAAETLDLVDPDEPLTPKQLEALAHSTEAAALAVDGVTQVEQASASQSSMTIVLAASNGFHGDYARTNVTLGVSALAGTGLGRESDYAYESRSHRADLPEPEVIGRKAGDRAVAALAPRKPPGGAVPVLYDERAAGSLIRHVLMAINGAQIARGASWLRDRMDGAVFPDGIDLTEDPLRVRGPSSRPFDAEGIAAKASPLITDGRLIRWVLDCASARKLGLETTGNARRGTGGPPQPGTSNVSLSQGSRSRADLIRDMGTGLVVTSLIGSAVNPTTGSYSRGASGFWVEGGEIAYPVNEITVAGSLPEMMRTIVPANDADPWTSLTCPSLLVEGLTVGA